MSITFNSLFAPTTNPTPQSKPDLLDRFAEHVNPTGSWDIYRIFENVFSWVKLLTGNQSNTLADRASTLSANLGAGLCIPEAICNINGLRHAFSDVQNAAALAHSDPNRSSRLARAVKQSAVEGNWLVNTFAQVVLFLEQGKILDLSPKSSFAANSVMNVTNLLGDGVEVVDQGYKVYHYGNSEQGWLSGMKFVKAISSVALAVIALVGLALGIAFHAVTLYAVGILALSTVWLAAKMAAYFYEQILLTRPA
ncbi:MAG: hypothetical protein JSS61_02400 [Verrucomicrobia bacterium]|nr:hypothetical protein [Verrucomicrobiota bacterium]